MRIFYAHLAFENSRKVINENEFPQQKIYVQICVSVKRDVNKRIANIYVSNISHKIY